MCAVTGDVGAGMSAQRWRSIVDDWQRFAAEEKLGDGMQMSNGWRCAVQGIVRYRRSGWRSPRRARRKRAAAEGGSAGLARHKVRRAPSVARLTIDACLIGQSR